LSAIDRKFVKVNDKNLLRYINDSLLQASWPWHIVSRRYNACSSVIAASNCDIIQHWMTKKLCVCFWSNIHGRWHSATIVSYSN